MKNARANKNRFRYIVHLTNRRLPEAIGNKAANLHQLKAKKFLIPNTYVCTWQAYVDYRKDGSGVLDQLRQEIQAVLQPGKGYAVRSSANLEDDLEHSFAGQFNTFLEVYSVDEIIQAIQEIWDNTSSEAIQTYTNKAFGGQPELLMAVILQEMIMPRVSGVAFSKNPITSLDEILVEAVIGSGVSLVQQGVTPMRWVYKWGNCVQRADDELVPLSLIQQVVDETQQIAKAFHRAVDLEWVYDGQKLYWLQLRDITSLYKSNIYSNRISKEMSPGLIKPLVWSVSIPVPARAWVRLISEVTGNQDIAPESLIRAFHYRAYYNMGVFGDILESLGLPRESLEMMMGILPPGAGKPPMKPSMRMVRLTPRILRFVVDKWNFAEKYEKNFPDLSNQAHAVPVEPAKSLDEGQLLAVIDQVMALNHEITYYTVVTILLMQAYNTFLRRQLNKQGVDFQQFSLTEGLDELNLYDPGSMLGSLHELYLGLSEEQQKTILDCDYNEFYQLPGIGEFQQQVRNFFYHFGHLSDTTSNFSSLPWRETPEYIIRLIADYQKPEQVVGRTRFEDLPHKSTQMKLSYHRARRFRLYREQSSSLYTYTLMLARAYYLALAKRMVQKGLLRNCQDIFMLYDQEIRSYLSGEIDGSGLSELAALRDQEMQGCQEALLPEIIFGEEAPLVMTKCSNKLCGTPTSKGYYTGTVRVVRGIQDFSRLSAGEVLVIPYSDAGWTPLFAKAGAVIAESGGILSHSSIIAREYNIPAVVSVMGALQLLDGTQVTVDGFKGEVYIHPPRSELVEPSAKPEYANLEPNH